MEAREKETRVNRFRPLSWSIFLISIIFIIFMCAVISYATYKIYTKSMYDRYQKQMVSIIDYVESHIDIDDMSECSRTYVESEKYKEFQAFFDDLIDYYSDVHYLYIMQVLDPEDPIKVREICAANSTYEKQYEPDMVMYLGQGEESWYDTETARYLKQLQDGDKDVYFNNPSEWGIDYTLARPLIDSKGNHYALLCVDVSIDEINTTIYRNIKINITVVVIGGIVLIALLMNWMRENVTGPLKQVERSVEEFAEKSAGIRNPDELIYTPPVLKRNNEVKALSEAVSKLSQDMKDYVVAILTAEGETNTLKDHVNQISTIAYQDSLTKVKNKSAYDEKQLELEKDIQDGTAEFAILMLDINKLKQINDLYGHEQGNEYIIGACRTICETFKHSPVYRVGGDEFTVVIQGEDYKNREELFIELNERFAESSKDESVEPWHRYSAACGMSEYRKGDEVITVFNRADKDMYKAKAKMEAEK